MKPNRIAWKGHMFDFDAVVNLMDAEICEEIHMEGNCTTDQEFMDAYAKAHQARHGEEFIIN